MDRIEKAVTLYQSGYTCSQALLASFSGNLGLETDTALRLATPFGGGIARKQLICGAVSGALMVLGLKYGRDSCGDENKKEITYTLSEKFMDEFSALHGSIDCLELLGHDMNTDEGRAEITAADLFSTQCKLFVRDAAAIVDKLLKEIP